MANGQVGTAPDPGKVWSLEDCIRTAKINNLQVQRQMLQVGAARTDLWLSKAANLPRLNGWYTHNLNSGKTVNFENYTYINTQYQDGNAGLQARLPLFQGLQGWNRMQQGKLVLQSAEQQAAAMEIQISLQVITAYLQILLSEELVKMAEDKLLVSNKLLMQAEEFFKTGRIARSEVLVIKSQAAQDQLDLIGRQGELEMASLVMNQLLNIDSDAPIVIEKPDDSTTDNINLPTVKAVNEYAQSNQPIILAAQSDIMANEAALRLARGSLAPSLSMGGLIYSRYSELGTNPLDPEGIYPYQEQFRDNKYMQANIRLEIPIFNRFSDGYQRQISQAKVNLMDSELVLEQEKKAMREEIQQAAAQAKTAQARLNAADIAATSAREANEIIKEQFDSGLVTAIDLRVSGNQLLLAMANQAQAKYELLLRSKILEIYQGKEVDL